MTLRLTAALALALCAAPLVASAQDASSEPSVASRLASIYDTVPSFEGISVEEEDGVVHLRGDVATSEAHEDAVEIASSLDGVIYVDDQLAETVAVGDRIGPLRARVSGWIEGAVERLPLIGLALFVFLAMVGLGRLLARRERLIGLLVRRNLLRTLAQRMVALSFSAVGLLLALEILDATTLVGTLLGTAGVIGIAVGFAFRDIAENYLASLLLVTRRPFAQGDSVKIGEHEGKVMRLTMRETVIMTFDGNHLSLPNAQVFKASILNYTRNPKRRIDFAVGAGVDTDLVAAQDLGVETLARSPGVIGEPAPLGVIEQLGDSNVALRFYAWIDQRETDYFKARSECIRRVKTALEAAGVDMPEPIFRVHLSEGQAAPSPARAAATRPRRQPEAAADVAPDDHIDRQIAAEARDDHNLLDDAA